MQTKKKSLRERLSSSRVLRVMFGRRIIVVCAGLVLVMILMAIFAPVVAPYDPNQDDLYNVLKGCSAEHWLGTDSNGRDVLSRIIYGARVSFVVGVVSVLISSVIGIALGLIWRAGCIHHACDGCHAGYPYADPCHVSGGHPGPGPGQRLPCYRHFDGAGVCPRHPGAGAQRAQRRLCDSRHSVWGVPHTQHAGACFPQLSVGQHRYHDGQSGWRYPGRSQSELSGHGHRAPTASWGAMVSGGYKYLSTQPVIAIAPGVAIIILVLCCNMCGDALRDALDPKLRGTLGSGHKTRPGRKNKPARRSDKAESGVA